MKTPRLADVQCSRLTFNPGDRVLVRTHQRLDKDARRKLHRTVQRWAGVDVEVLIYCLLDMEVDIEHK